MRSLLRFLAGVVLPIALIVVGAQLLRPGTVEEPPPPSLEADATPAPTVEPPEGTWRIVAEESFVGYRIDERDPRRGARTNEGVGRTSAIDGRVTVADGAVVDAAITVDLVELESAEPRRDQMVRRRYLESFAYPEARFELTAPVTLDRPGGGTVEEAVVEGRLELREHATAITVPVEVLWDGRAARVVGRGRIDLDDVGIDPPQIAGFRFVDDEGYVELDLTLRP